MNRKERDEWVAELRSGKWKQARTMLYDPKIDGYCCLGVKVALREKVFCNRVTAVEHQDDMGYFDATDGGELTQRYLDLIGLEGDTQDKLIVMNDGDSSKFNGVETVPAIEPKSFAEIADWIEQNVPVDD